jgi:phage shock protein A
MTQSPDNLPASVDGVSESTEPVTDYTDGGVPTINYVRDQIEGRIAMSIGEAELAGETQPARSLDEQFAEREKAGKDRLEQIRRSMRGDK